MRMPFYMRPHSFASSARTHGTKRKRRRNEADLPGTGVGQAGLAPLKLLDIYIYIVVPDLLNINLSGE